MRVEGFFNVFLNLVLLKSERKSKKKNLVLLVREDSSVCSEGGEETASKCVWGCVDLLPTAQGDQGHLCSLCPGG